MNEHPDQAAPGSDDPAAARSGPALEPRPGSRLGGLRRLAGTGLLAVGLLGVLGVAAVNAATPSASPSAPSSAAASGSAGSGSTGSGSGGTTTHHCP